MIASSSSSALGVEPSNLSCGLNVCYIRTYLEKVFSSPMKHSLFPKRQKPPQANVITSLFMRLSQKWVGNKKDDFSFIKNKICLVFFVSSEKWNGLHTTKIPNLPSREVSFMPALMRQEGASGTRERVIEILRQCGRQEEHKASKVRDTVHLRVCMCLCISFLALK